jgi:hypothetical protein
MEAFARTGEKNMLKNMFGGSDSDSDSDGDGGDSDGGGGTGRELPPSDVDGDGDADGPATTVETYRSLTGAFEVLLHQQRRKGIAHQLWPAATFLSHYLEQHPDVLFGPTTTTTASSSSSSSGSGSGSHTGPGATSVVELGAGVGLCGLVCSKLQCGDVILTDLPVALPLLDANIAINRRAADAADTDGEVRAMVLSWGCDDDVHAVMHAARRRGPDQRVVAIAADCVYWEVLFAPLYETLRVLVLDYGVDVVIAHVKVRAQGYYSLWRFLFLLNHISRASPRPRCSGGSGTKSSSRCAGGAWPWTCCWRPSTWCLTNTPACRPKKSNAFTASPNPRRT